MQYSTIFLATFAASGTMAAPHYHNGWVPKNDKSGPGNDPISIILKGAGNLKSTTTFAKAGENAVPDKSGPFTSVALVLDPAFENQALRCKIFNEDGDRIAVKRGANEDVTFADGGNGPWSFLEVEDAKVGNITCDETFTKIADVEKEKTFLQVTLSNQAVELGIGVPLIAGERDEQPRNDKKNLFETVNLDIGDLVDPTYRCQILDDKDDVIMVKRGDKVAATFGRGDELGKDGKALGEWTLVKPRAAGDVDVENVADPENPQAEDFEEAKSLVNKVICDPEF